MKKIFILLLSVLTFLSFSTVSAKSNIRLLMLTKECTVNPFLTLGYCGILGNDSWRGGIGSEVGIESKIIEFNKNLSFNTGLGVSFQGAAWEESEMSGRVNLSYLNVPLLFNYRSELGFYGEIGLQPGILLSAKDKLEGESYDYKDYVKGFNMGIPIGAGFHVNENLSLGIRATIGITNLDDTGSDVSDHNLLVAGIIRYIIDWPSKN